MGAEMFFLRNQGTPGGFWLGPGRGQGGEDDPLSCPPKERTLTSLSFFLFQSWSSAFCHFPPHRSVCGSLILHLSAFCVGICVHTALQQHLLHTYTAIHHHSYTHFHSQSFPQSIPLLEQRRYAHLCTFKISWICTVCSTWEKRNQGEKKAFISECKPVKVNQKEYFNLMCFWKYSLNPLCQEDKGETEEEKRRKRIRKDVKRKERDTAKGEKENIEKGWERRKGE